MSDLKVARLIYVEGRGGANNNKYYDMYEQGDGTFRVEYGRVDRTKTTQTYGMHKWTSTLRSKLRKGYTDQTHLYAVPEKGEERDLFDISDPDVKSFMTTLDGYSKKSMKDNYKVSSDKVTLAMVKEAQGLLDNIVPLVVVGGDVEAINRKLLELFKIIPRAMSNVGDYLIQGTTISKDQLDSVNKHIASEQATLDVMRGQVEANAALEKKDKENKEDEKNEKIDILGVMGIDVELVKDQETIDMIKKLMDQHAGKFQRAFRVKCHKSRRKYTKYVKPRENRKKELFWHGSRNENWLSIMQGGLILRPTNAVITGKMFGYGTYFADQFRKSLNYTSYRGSYYAGGNSDKAYLALFKVHVGNQYHITNWKSEHSQLTEERLRKIGDYDSVFAHGGADLINNEYIVYNEGQTTIKYVVEIGC